MKNRNLAIFFSVFSVLFFWASWTALWMVISSENIRTSWILAILLFFALLCFGYFVMLAKSQKNTAIVCALCVAGFVPLGFGNWRFMSGIVLLCWLLFLFGAKRIKKEQKDRLSVNMHLTLKRGIAIIGLAISVLIASSFYFSLVERSRTSKVSVIEIKIPQAVTDGGLSLAGMFFSDQNFKQIAEGATVDQYITQVINSQESQGGVVLPEGFSAGEAARAAMLEQGREKLSRQFGIELSGREKMNELVNMTLENRANEIFIGDVSSDSMFPFGAAIAIFLAAYSLTWILGILVLWTSEILFYILSRLQVIAINKETKEAESID